MPTRKSPRKGSLQFWPRKRAAKFVPRVNWDAVDSSTSLKGFLGYKAGMTSVLVKDNTPDSLTSGKRITIPATIIECPPMRVYSVRLYNNKKVAMDILVKDVDKELKRKIKLSKNAQKTSLDDVTSEKYDDLRLLVYSQVKKTGIKKKPDLLEIGLQGSFEERLSFAKEHLGKELRVSDLFSEGQLLDVRGVTKGKGFQGPVKRFGIQLKNQKSEKGRRRPGSIGPWNPSRVIFRVPMAGQTGLFTRPQYNNAILAVKSGADEPLQNIKNYGSVTNDYVLVKGSVHGPAKRVMVLTQPLRVTKKQKKKSYEVISLH